MCVRGSHFQKLDGDRNLGKLGGHGIPMFTRRKEMTQKNVRLPLKKRFRYVSCYSYVIVDFIKNHHPHIFSFTLKVRLEFVGMNVNVDERYFSLNIIFFPPQNHAVFSRRSYEMSFQTKQFLLRLSFVRFQCL